MIAISPRRVSVAFVVVIALLSTTRRAKADDEAPDAQAPDEPRPYEHAPEKPSPSRLHVSTSAMLTFGSFVGIPVMRAGPAIEVRTRFLSAHALFALGRTPNGLGAHRIEIGGNLTSPIGWFRASIGPHFGYAMLVRRTEQNALLNALLGDIASFSIGVHAAMELSVPVSENVRLFVAGRVMGELYRRRQGWEIGPTIGLHF